MKVPEMDINRDSVYKNVTFNSKMLKYVLLACFAASVLGLPKSSLKSRIIGGHTVSIEAYPYQVQIQLGYGGVDDSIFRCGGTIVGPKHVVTSATCADRTLEPQWYEGWQTKWIRADSADLYKDGILIQIKNITKHPLFSTKFPYDYNIAVIELEEALEYGPGIQSVALPKKGQFPKAGSTVSATGWGVWTVGGQSIVETLQAVQVNVRGKDACSEEYLGSLVLTERQICAASQIGSEDGPCNYDEGAPLAFEGVLHGIWAYGICGVNGSSSIYTSLATLGGWVQGIIDGSN